VSEHPTPIGILVVTHGHLGAELVEAAQVILGERPSCPPQALSVGWNDPLDDARARVREAIEAEDRGRGVLVLTDMFGGTPTNLCLSFLETERVEIVTGVNLPMLVKCLNLAQETARGLTLREIARRVAEKGSSSVVLASRMLEP
jgi:PTS system mannose-specific IIA component